MEDYINNSDLQQVHSNGQAQKSRPCALAEKRSRLCRVLQLMHSLMTEVFTKKPENTIDFMLQWLEKEKERRVDEKLAMQR